MSSRFFIRTIWIISTLVMIAFFSQEASVIATDLVVVLPSLSKSSNIQISDQELIQFEDKAWHTRHTYTHIIGSRSTHVLTTNRLLVVANKHAKEVELADSFLIEMNPVKNWSVKDAETFMDLNGKRVTVTNYIAAYSFSLYYRATEKTPLIDLGSGIVQGKAVPVESIEADAADGNVSHRIRKMSPRQLALEALVSACQTLLPEFDRSEDPIGSAISRKLVVPSGVPVETLKDMEIRSKFATPGSTRYQEFGISLPNPGEGFRYYQHTVVFPASRTTMQKDGTLLVELAMWNRLPMIANGVIHYGSVVPQWIGGPRDARNFAHAETKEFTLAPNEKVTQKFILPAQAVVPNRMELFSIYGLKLTIPAVAKK